MTESWKSYISGAPSTSVIHSISSYVEEAAPLVSPIDQFYKERNDLVRAITPNTISHHPSLSSLALVGLISSTENYFRSILAEIIRICPIAKEKSAERPLNLASVWFGYSNIERGAFENVSFSNPEEIKKNLKKIIGFELEKISDLQSPLKNFSELCELRHAIVHCAGLLSGKNAIKLHLPLSNNAMKVKVGFDEFQEAAAICTSLVQAMNHELFDDMVNKWAFRWPQTAAYQNEAKLKLFKLIWKAFVSTTDQSQQRTEENITPLRLKNKIERNLFGE